MYLTPESITKHGSVQREIKLALDSADQKPEGTIYVIPAELEPCDLPNRQRRWQWIDLFKDRGYDRLVLSWQTKRV